MPQVLDHGYIKFIRGYGSDRAVIEDARMSTMKGFRGWARDSRLLEYLYTHKHMTPFEGSGATFEIKAPILVFREWHRHRTQSYSEMSGRYVELPNENYIPEAGRILDACSAVSKNKQLQGVNASQVKGYTDAYKVQEQLRVEYRCQQLTYESLLAQGLPKELARISLPVGRYSVMRATGNLRNWLAFLTLRSDPAAQYEIRVYAEQLEAILERKFPRTLALFKDNKG